MEFKDALKSGKFIVTMDVIPPKGTDLSATFQRLHPLKQRVDAFNVADMPSAVMRMSSLAAAYLLRREGVEPILQMTCRDRNRLSLQADLLGASALGLANVLMLTGDPVELSDDHRSKPVFDFDSTALLRAARELELGHDVAGKPLTGSPRFCLGASADPGAERLEEEIAEMESKAGAGAEFFQTQPVYDVEAFAGFMRKAGHVKLPVLAGIFLLKSAKMGRFMNQHVPGVRVPESILVEMEGCKDPFAKSMEIAVRTIRALRDMVQGVHIMTVHWEDKVAGILDALSLP